MIWIYPITSVTMRVRYLDQLGMASKYNTKVYCRQSLIGGNYGLLNMATFVPNPDYYRHVHFKLSHSLEYSSEVACICYCFTNCYFLRIADSALLWHQLMGKGVVPVDGDASAYLRYYAHCTKGRVSLHSTYFLLSPLISNMDWLAS